MEEIIQKKIDQILNLAAASVKAPGAAVGSAPTSNDGLLKVIRNKVESAAFFTELDAAVERARRAR